MANNGLKLTILFLFIITYEYCSTHVKLPTFTNTSTRSTYLIKDVFILAGQSNMAGRGGVIDKNWDGIIPPEVKPRPGKILRLGGDLTWEGGGEIRGVLWFQGERDTLNISDAELYKERLRKLFIDLRTDLKSPLLPVIQVALASGEGPYIELVRKAQHEINLPNVVTVDAKGLLLQPDGLHLSTNAQVQVGKMLAHAMLRSRCYS
ncbi:putative sialate O-acetylesterase domain, SGNH hydrolase superfamily [Helianthus annuus]|nr:putative sialate O-acetylesterase domain, SGNH hydrolase superfamily [Helianthus annuus]